MAEAERFKIKNCHFKKAIFTKDDFKIAVFKADKKDIPKGKSNEFYGNNYFTAIGYFPTNSTIQLDLEGDWEKSKYGYQLKVTVFEEKVPATRDGIISYLSSGLIKGIGPTTAERIYDTFGNRTLEVIEGDPSQLLTVKGISPKKLEKIVSCYKETKGLKEILQYLAPYGVSPNKCIKIHQKFGGDSIRIVKENPYHLQEVDGFGFKIIDGIARATHVAMNDPLRISSAIKFTLESKKKEGHVCYEQKALLKEAYDLLNEDFSSPVCSIQEVLKGFLKMAKEKILCGDRGYAYLEKDYKDEVQTADMIARKIKFLPIYNAVENKDNEKNSSLSKYKNSYNTLSTPQSKKHTRKNKRYKKEEIMKIISELEDIYHVTLADKQKEAIVMETQENFCITTGGPGTGKTTSLYFFLKTYEMLNKKKQISVKLLAPCARAARRLGESCKNEYSASTIHSAIGITPDGEWKEQKLNTLDYDIVVVDECSMCDAHIFYLLLNYLPQSTKLILLGDPEQLPSVGAGNVLFELLQNTYIPRVKLETIYRQGKESLIVVNSSKIEHGDTKLKYGNDFTFDRCMGSEDTAEKVVDLFMKEYAEANYDLSKVQILSPFKKEGIAAGATELNKKIQAIINPLKKGKLEYKRHGYVFREGDKVIQTANTKEVSNGDMGIIKSITSDKKVIINFADQTLEYEGTDMDHVDLAYAISIHKFQGSECKTVIMPIIKAFYIMLRRNLIYTGITRGKQKVALVGEPQALAMAINNNDVDKRNTFLSERINDAVATLDLKLA